MSTRRVQTGEELRGASPGRLSQREVAERIGASPGTLRRWVRRGLVPRYDEHDGWTPAAVRNATVVARMRVRGHSFSEILSALEEGRLAYAYTEELLTAPGRLYKLDDVAAKRASSRHWRNES